MKAKLNFKQLNHFFEPAKAVELADIQFINPKKPKKPAFAIKGSEEFAFRPEDPKVPKGFKNIGGLPIRIKDKKPQIPPLLDIRDQLILRPWQTIDWKNWLDLSGNDCTLIPAKTSQVDIAVPA